MERIKVTLRKRVYQGLLDDIDRANKDLLEFTQHGISLEPMRRKRRSKRPIAELKLIRRHATSLYQVLMSNKAWRCSCRVHHMASLRLEARPPTSEEVKTSTPPDCVFRVMITVADQADSSGVTTRWEEIEVVPSLESQKLNLVLDHSHHHPVRKGVRFASDINPPSGRVPTETIPTQTDWTCIKDMCSALCTPVLNRRAIGLLVDDAFDKHQHKLYRANTVVKSQTLSRSLEDLLEASRQPGDDSLSRKERLQIAVVLASSVLQLDGTSWFKRGWSSSDICFHTEDSQSLGVAEPRRFPYLSWQPCCYDILPPPLERLYLNNHMIRNDTLLALGLVLVELCFGRTLTEMRKPEDLDKEATVTKLRTATRLHTRVYTEMGPLYGDVVRR
ncbi:MAG: hypothetical protein L6R42_005726, partial [Xanthoria sp. 1 TBL-2021]